LDSIVLLKLGELVLKGMNRRKFEERLIGNLKRKLYPLGRFHIYSAQSVIFVEPLGECDMDAATELCSKTFGVISLARAYCCDKTPEAILARVLETLSDDMRSAKSFKVESRRSDKRFPLTSIQLSQYIGGELNDAFPECKVDVHNPELKIVAEVRDNLAYVHGGNIRGAGGLPVGSSGRAVALLSGGIDSPVAIHMMARRGLNIIPLHFISPPYTSELAKEKVLSLAKILLPWCEKLVVHLVKFTRIQEEIRSNCPEELFTIISRRFMARIAERLARYHGAGSIITGESLGQVASQTQAAIAVSEECVSLPVLRPLIGLDKSEIVIRARELGTLETSELPYEDCCTVFTPRHPKTNPRLQEILDAESVLDIEYLIDEAYASMELVEV